MGRHNGHEAFSYTPLIDLDPPLAGSVIDMFADAGIAAYVTPATRRSPSGELEPTIDRPLDRVYVDATALVRASALLRERLPALRAEHDLAARGADGPMLLEDPTWASIVASFSMPSDHLS